MRAFCACAAAAAAAVTLCASQPVVDAKLDSQLHQLFPDASTFSAKGGNPPHFKVFKTDDRSTLAGVAFWTTDLDPLERGYDGPIKILVGLALNGTLAGVIVADHHEPYGSFSVDRPEFAAQFRGKRLTDAFRVGRDVDAVSRATLTVTSAARAIRNSARRMAGALPSSAPVSPPAPVTPPTPAPPR
jgi:transcriptional regulator of nitric oxide reductase